MSVDDHAVLDQLDRRDDDPFLEDLLEGADAGRRAAADVDVVGEAGDVAEDLALVHERRDEGHVVEVPATDVRVVDQDRVTRSEALRAVVGDRRRAPAGRASRGGSAGRTTGRWRASCASKNAHEKSARVLMLVE